MTRERALYGRLFQSTPLTRGETGGVYMSFRRWRFQSTPLTRGETFSSSLSRRVLVYFNPLPSHEGRRD